MNTNINKLTIIGGRLTSHIKEQTEAVIISKIKFCGTTSEYVLDVQSVLKRRAPFDGIRVGKQLSKGKFKIYVSEQGAQDSDSKIIECTLGPMVETVEDACVYDKFCEYFNVIDDDLARTFVTTVSSELLDVYNALKTKFGAGRFQRDDIYGTMRTIPQLADSHVTRLRGLFGSMVHYHWIRRDGESFVCGEVSERKFEPRKRNQAPRIRKTSSLESVVDKFEAAKNHVRSVFGSNEFSSADLSKEIARTGLRTELAIPAWIGNMVRYGFLERTSAGYRVKESSRKRRDKIVPVERSVAEIIRNLEQHDKTRTELIARKDQLEGELKKIEGEIEKLEPFSKKLVQLKAILES